MEATTEDDDEHLDISSQINDDTATSSSNDQIQLGDIGEWEKHTRVRQ